MELITLNSAIYREINQQNTLDTMIPLSDIVDEKKKKEYEEQGYMAGYTAEAWSKEFPHIDPKFVLCPRTVLFPASLVYYDPEHFICFDMHIYAGGMMLPPTHGKEEKTFADMLDDRIGAGMKDYENKEYRKLLMPMASEESGNIAIHILRNMLEREEPSPELYRAFLSIYTLCNCGAHLLGTTALERLRECKSEEQKEETNKSLSQFEGDSLTVYRGEASESTPHQEACSWTTDINKAYFFASWRSAEESRVLTGKVSKADVIDYIDDRNEHEVLVVPGTVKRVRQQRCAEWDMVQKVVAAEMFDKSHKFPKESLIRNIMSELNDVYGDTDVADHDKTHSLRVAILANYMFRMDVLLEAEDSKAKFQAACQVLADLSRAIVYHDAGRDDNTPNAEHGAVGYERFKKAHGENPTVRFLTTYHCRQDEEARAYWEKNFTGKNAETVWKAFCILKDADALDRVRFGNLSGDYVDVSMLRSDTAKTLLPVAHQLVDAKIQ